MEKKKRPPPPEHTRFKPGQSGNPSGRAKSLVKPSEVMQMMGEFWSLDRSALEVIATDPKQPMGRSWVAAMMVEGHKTGDYTRLNFFLDRTIGKVKEQIQVEAKPFIRESLDGSSAKVMGIEQEGEE